MIPILAGIVSMLAGKGLDLVSSAIDGGADKAKEFIEEKTGIKLDGKELSDEQVAKLRELEINSKIELEKLALENKREDNRASEAVAAEVNKNTADARAMNTSVQTSAEASKLAKNAAYYLDLVIVVSTVVLAFMLFVMELPIANKELAYMMFGSLVTLTGTIVNFHRGSSQGSVDKNEFIKGK